MRSTTWPRDDDVISRERGSFIATIFRIFSPPSSACVEFVDEAVSTNSFSSDCERCFRSLGANRIASRTLSGLLIYVPLRYALHRESKESSMEPTSNVTLLGSRRFALEFR